MLAGGHHSTDALAPVPFMSHCLSDLLLGGKWMKKEIPTVLVGRGSVAVVIPHLFLRLLFGPQSKEGYPSSSSNKTRNAGACHLK